MIACLDVDYRPDRAVAACVLAENWTSAAAAREFSIETAPAPDYVPGQFYLRELPCLLAVLKLVTETPTAIVIDGYVWLDEAGRPGLGARLLAALDQPIPIVGIAKTEFRGAPAAQVLHGQSRRPLWVTAAGMEPAVAAELVRSMHGPFRVPTLVKAADRVCRTGLIHSPASDR